MEASKTIDTFDYFRSSCDYDLETHTELKHKIRIFIPSKSEGDEIDQDLVDEVNQEVNKKLSEINGGTTVNVGEGYWVSGSDELVSERVKIVECYGNSKNEELVVNLAHYIKEELNQEAVSYVVDGIMKII